MTMIQTVDTVVIGGGMAGLPMALRAARHGRIILMESDRLGGTCLNRGCIPTKTMIHSAKIAHLARRSAEFGVDTGEVAVDMAAVVARKNEVVAGIRDGSYRAVTRADGLELVEARARFVDERTVEANGVRYRAENVVINTGAFPTIPESIGETGFLTSTEALDLDEVPRHLIVVGGGYVGCEYAQMFRRFGAEVTLIQRASRLLPAEDPEVSAVVESVFTDEEIEVRTGTTMLSVTGASGVSVKVETDDGPVSGSHLLVATGRTPNTTDLGPDKAGVAVDEHGFVKVDLGYATSAPRVFAIGDVVGPPMFTHSARDDAALLYRSLFHDEDIDSSHRLVPHAVFTDPEVASFGLTEETARTSFGDGVVVGVEHFRGVGRARAIGETAGFVKIVADPKRRIVGGTVVGAEGGELIHEIVVAAAAGMTVDELRGLVHIHPTLAEGVSAAAGGAHRPTYAE